MKNNELKKCIPDDMVYLSNPVQNRCKDCGQFWFPSEGTPNCKNVEINTISPVLPTNSEKSSSKLADTPSSGMKWEKEFIGKFCTPDKDFTPYMIQVAEANKRMIPFISQAISEAYKRGKHDGFAEEGVNCDKHCEETRADTVLKGERRRIIEQIRGEIEADIRADERKNTEKVEEELAAFHMALTHLPSEYRKSVLNVKDKLLRNFTIKKEK